MARVTDSSGRAVSGTVPYAVIGVVTDVDDPDKLGRVRVQFPTLAGTPQSGWIRHVAPSAGKDHGLYDLPDVGDEVVVLFLYGSYDHGVVIGGLWGGKSKPPGEALAGSDGGAKVAEGAAQSPAAGSGNHEKNERRMWRSRSGHAIRFDDTQGAESVHIWDSSGELALVFDSASKSIFLSSNSADVSIHAGGNLSLEAGGDLTITAGGNLDGTVKGNTTWKTTGNAKHEATGNVDVKATGNLTLNATGNATLKATGQLNAEGSMATVKASATLTLQGGAMAELKAALVKIN